MPNWCFSEIKIHHKDVKKLENLDAKFATWTSKEIKQSGFGKEWLGNVVLASGIGTVEGNNHIACRGVLYDRYLDKDNKALTLYTETAWSPMLKLFSLIVEKYLPDATITFRSEESGTRTYLSNDLDIVGKYYVNPYDIDSLYVLGIDVVETVEIAEKKDVVELLQDVLQTKESDFNNLLAMLEAHEDIGLSIEKYEYCDINDCD